MTHTEFGLVTSRTVCVQVQSWLTLRDPMDGTPPGSSVLGFSRQEDWSGLTCPSPGDLLDQGIKPETPESPALAGGLFTTNAAWEALELWENKLSVALSHPVCGSLLSTAPVGDRDSHSPVHCSSPPMPLPLCLCPAVGSLPEGLGPEEPRASRRLKESARRCVG